MSQEDNESFASMFEKQAAPKAKKSYRLGERLRARVVQVGKDAIFVELEGNDQAFIEREELAAEDGSVTIKEGDYIDASVVAIDEAKGSLRLGVRAARGGGIEGLMAAREGGFPVEGKITGTNKGGFEVELGGGTRAFVPMSHIDAKPVTDANAWVGQSHKFLITEIKDGGRSIVLSRRQLLAHEGRADAQKMMASLTPGSVVRGTVTGTRDFGAFVDLGGIEGLIPRSEIGHDRGVSVQDALKAGDVVEVMVREIKEDPKSKNGQKRITLSLKALMDDPWSTLDLAPSSVVTGSVARIVDFGAFIRVAPGIDGLLSNGDLGANKKLEVGQQINVVVDNIDKKEHKIRLLPAPEGATVGSRVAKASLAVGAIVKGKVERIETYGVFLQVEGTSGRAGRGLIPVSELGVARGVDLKKAFPEGTELVAKVIETNEGKLKLSVRGAKTDEEQQQYHEARAKMGANKGFGTLGDLLAKMKK